MATLGLAADFKSPVASGIVVGFGGHGYVLAIHGLHQLSQGG